MSFPANAVDATANTVKVNKLKDSYTWNVQVIADSNSLEHLRDAKAKALEIGAELDADLERPPTKYQTMTIRSAKPVVKRIRLEWVRRRGAKPLSACCHLRPWLVTFFVIYRS
jgi:hypothetical protein